jgi:ATP phosphoribosyltransferase
MPQRSPRRLTLGIPEEKRVGPLVMDLLGQAGYRITNLAIRQKKVDLDGPAGHPPLTLELAKGPDLCLFLQEKAIDGLITCGITVEEWMAGRPTRPCQVHRVFNGVSAVRLVLAAPQNRRDEFSNGSWPDRTIRIATSYPGLTWRFLWEREQTSHTHIVVLKGGVEAALRRGLADLIADVTQTGQSLREYDLVEIATMGSYAATLYGSVNNDNPALVQLAHALGAVRPAP